MDFDSLPDDAPTGSTAPQSEAVPSFDDMPAPMNFDTMPGEEITSSGVGAFLRRGLQEVPAGAAAGLAGVAGSIPGAAAGTAVGGPVGGFAGGLATGVPSAIYVGGKVHDAQEWLLDQLGLREGTGFFSRAQEMADRAQHPTASFMGELTGNTVPGFGTGLAASGGKLASEISGAGRGLGAGLQAGMEAGSEAWRGEELDPVKIAGAGAAGAVFAKPRGWMNPVTKPLERMTGQGEPPVKPGETPPPEPPQAPGPEAPEAQRPQEAPRAAAPMEGEVLPPEKTPTDREFATEQRDAYPRDDPMWQFWDEHAKMAHDEEARWGPPNEDGFTYVTPQDMARANDVTTVALGVATENSRAPEVRGAGNPVGAPMGMRIATRPNSPSRDYRKPIEPKAAEQGGTTEGHFAPEIATAIRDPEVAPVAPQGPEPSPVPVPGEQAPHQGKRVLEPLNVQPQDVTAAVTPQEQARLNEHKKLLGGMKDLMGGIKDLPPKVQLQVLDRAVELLTKQQKAEYDTQARPQVATGVTARSKADLARKQGVLDAYDKAVAEHGRAGENEDQGAMMDRLGKLVKRADELSGGAKYRPNDKPPGWQLVQAARKVLQRPTGESITAYKKAELAMVEGDAELARTNQNEKAIDKSLEEQQKRPDPLQTYDNMAAAKEDTPRIVHEEIDNSNGEESHVHKTQHDALTNWLNHLSDESYQALSRAHDGELDLTVKSTRDPRSTMYDLMGELADIEGKRPGVIELVPAEDAPTSVRRPIRKAADLDPGVSLKESNPELFKKLAAEYTATNDGKPLTKEEQLAKIDERLAEERAAVDGTGKSALEHWAAFMSDESGSVNVGQIGKDLYDWMKSSTKGFWHPAVPDPIKEYGQQLGGAFTLLGNRITRQRAELLANATSALYPDGKRPSKTEFGQMYRAFETNSVSALPKKMQDYAQAHIQPIFEKIGPVYDELRDITQRLKLPGWETMPERKNNGADFASWFPRIQKGKQHWDAADDIDPIVSKGQSLSNFAPSGQEREWMALQNKNTGERKIYHINDDEKMVFYKNGQAGRAQTVPNGFDPKDIGSVLKVRNSKAGSNSGQPVTHDWVVDHAKIDELNQHGRGEGGVKLEFHDNPVVTVTQSLDGLRSALNKARLLEHILNDPKFQDLNVKSEKEAQERWGNSGYAQTRLEQVKDRYMPKPLAWAFDDFVKRGFDYKGSKAAKGFADFASNTAKVFYFFGPMVHVMNEADKFIIGRGWDWVTPQGWRSLVKNGMDGIKSVRTQDATQREIAENGGNLMYLHSATSRLMPNVARMMGEEIAGNASKWDPVAKAYGITTKDLAQLGYQKSSNAMWYLTDMMGTIRYMEEKAKNGGDKAAAVKSMHDFIDSYVMPPTVGKSIGIADTDWGRGFQKFLSDRTTSLFAPYHYGVFHSLAKMTSKLLAPNSTKAERIEAAGQWVMTGVMSMMVYPALSAAYASLTGNEHSEVEKRGVSRMVSTIHDVPSGKKDFADVLRNVWFPSTPADTVIRGFQNKDFRGKPILDASGGMAKVPGQLGEFLAGQTVSPYKTISQGYQENGVPRAIGKFIESNLGLKTPTEGSVKHETQLQKIQARQAKARERKPNGLIESGVNWLVR